MASAVGATTMETGLASARPAPQLSDPCSVTLNVPHVVGAPAIVPVDPLSDSPPGSGPAIAHSTVPTLPVAVAVSWYGWPTVAAGDAGAVIEKGGGSTVSANPPGATLSGQLASWTRTVTEKGPSSVGAPLSVPLASSVIPAGKCPEVTDQVIDPDPPVAESDPAYGVR